MFFIQHSAETYDNITCESENTADFRQIKYVTRYLYTLTELKVNGILYPVILVCGVVMNIMYLFVCITSRRMHTTTNFYLANLAIADCMFLSVALGEEITQFYRSPIENDRFYAGQVGCILIQFIIWYCYIASILIVTLVTADRYLAICNPISHLLLKSKRRTITITIVTWLTSFVVATFSIPTYSYYKIYCAIWPPDRYPDDYPEVFALCEPEIWWATFVFHVIFVLFVDICMLSILVMCCRIFRSLHRRTQRSEQSVRSLKQSLKIRNSVAFMLTVNAVVFFLCQAPYQTTILVEMVLTFLECPALCGHLVWNQWIWIAGILVYVNSVVNPIVYNATNPQCRQEYRRVFGCLCRRVRSPVFMKKHYEISSVSIELNGKDS